MKSIPDPSFRHTASFKRTCRRRRSGWETWNRGSAPPRAPLPVYQRQHSGNRYPSQSEQRVLQTRNYRYRPHDPVVQQHDQTLQWRSAFGTSSHGRQPARQEAIWQQDTRGSGPPASLRQRASPAHGQPQPRGDDVQKPAVAKAPPRRPPPTAAEPGRQPQQALRHAGQLRSQGDNGPRNKGRAPESEQGQNRGGERAGQSDGDRSN
jgi:hypothetical protein